MLCANFKHAALLFLAVGVRCFKLIGTSVVPLRKCAFAPNVRCIASWLEGEEGAMAAAEQLREEFIRELERMKMKYQVVDEADNIVRVSFGLDEMAVTVFFDFDENEDRARAVHFSAPLVAEFDEENLAEIFVAVNGLNNRFRFVKWVIDADMCTISCEADEFLFGGAGKARVCADLLRSFGLRRKV